MKVVNILFRMMIAFLATGCNEFLTQEPETKVTNINFWKTEQDVESAVYGVHAEFRRVFGDFVNQYRDRGILFDYLADGVWAKGLSNELSVESGEAPTFSWHSEYRLVAQVNSVIDNIHRADLEEGRRGFYLGQALFIRAFTYFHLIRMWGDVPLVEFSEDTGMKARLPWRMVADFIIGDLKKAGELLPDAGGLRDSKGGVLTSKQIPSKGTVDALLAHVYAWIAGFGEETGFYAEGIKAADRVINGSSYHLAHDPGEVCIKVMRGNSSEGILELDYDIARDEYKGSGSYLAGACQKWPVQPNTTPATARSYRIKNTTVYGLYPDPEDQRRQAYFYKLDSMAGVAISVTREAAYVWKWREPVVYTDGNQVGKMKSYNANDILIRLADIILLRAEMKEKTGDVAGAVADLNIVRRRAGARDYSPAEGKLSRAIALERDKELLLEGYCIRYFDRVRNRTYRDLKGAFKELTDADVANGALFLPVGSYAFQDNPPMRQSVYWKANGFNY